MENNQERGWTQDPSASKQDWIREMKKERCRLLEDIHEKQQELDRLDYILQKVQKEK